MRETDYLEPQTSLTERVPPWLLVAVAIILVIALKNLRGAGSGHA